MPGFKQAVLFKLLHSSNLLFPSSSSACFHDLDSLDLLSSLALPISPPIPIAFFMYLKY